MKKILGTVAAICFMAFSADAAVVKLTGISAQWTTTNPLITDGLGTNSIKWGDPATAAGKSGYDFNAAAAPSNDIAPGSRFALGDFVHQNNPIFGQSISQATLVVAIKLMIGATEQLVNTSYVFSHWETPNIPATGANCANGAAYGTGVNSAGCADRVTALVNLGSSSSFLIGTDEYVFTFEGFKVGTETFNQFWTIEQADNMASLSGSYVLKSCVVSGIGCGTGGVDPVSEVPVPAAGLMLVAGIGGLIAAKRRRRAA